MKIGDALRMVLVLAHNRHNDPGIDKSPDMKEAERKAIERVDEYILDYYDEEVEESE